LHGSKHSYLEWPQAHSTGFSLFGRVIGHISVSVTVVVLHRGLDFSLDALVLVLLPSTDRSIAWFVINECVYVCIRKFITRRFLQPNQSRVRARRPY